MTTNALAMNRRGFFEMFFGSVAVAIATPAVERMSKSRWGHILQGTKSANPVTSVVGHVTTADLADAYSQVERHDLQVRHVYMHPDTYKKVSFDYGKVFDESGENPRLWGADIHLTDEVSRKQVYVVGAQDDPNGVAEIRVIS